jgi:hypothetical protein
MSLEGRLQHGLLAGEVLVERTGARRQAGPPLDLPYRGPRKALVGKQADPGIDDPLRRTSTVCVSGCWHLVIKGLPEIAKGNLSGELCSPAG